MLTPRAAKRYWFSVGPWRLAELFVPNFSAVVSAAPALAGRVPLRATFGPSLYMGIVPLLLAGVTWRSARCDPRCGWLWTVAVLAVLASFGRYGLGWCGEELGLVTPAAADLPDRFAPPVGCTG